MASSRMRRHCCQTTQCIDCIATISVVAPQVERDAVAMDAQMGDATASLTDTRSRPPSVANTTS